MDDGRKTSEHARAWRAEAFGAFAFAAGAVLAFLVSWYGIALMVAGVLAHAYAAGKYAESRGSAKRPPTNTRIPRI